MKNRKIKKRSFKIVAALVMTSVIGIHLVTSRMTSVYAEDIIITGDAAGSFSITSIDNMLFDLTGLYPGDRSSSSVTIRNTDMVNEGFEMLMYAENTLEDSIDLGRVTRLRVTDGSTVIYDGMLVNFDDNINRATPVPLGRLERGTEKTLDFFIELDGVLTDNDYQEQKSHFVVTFAAYSYGPPVSPPTTPPPEIIVTTDDDPTPGVELDEPFVPLAFFEPQADEEPEIIVPDDDVPPPDVELDDPYVPLAYFEPSADVEPEPGTEEPDSEEPDSEEPDSEEPDSEEPDVVELDDVEVPLADKEMPKTGERALALSLVPGLIIICFGLFIIKGKSKKKMN